MIFCYLLFPLIMRLIDRSQRYFFLAASMLLAVYFVVIQFVPDALFNGLIYINPLFRLPDFILGVIIWQLIGRSLKTDSPRVPKFSFAVASAIELSVIALFTLTVVAYGFVSLRYGLVSLWWPASLAFIGIFALFNDNGGIVSRVFRLRPLVSFGNVSFSFYMVHVLVIQVARWSLKKYSLDVPHPLFVIAVFVIAVGVAYAVGRYFEKPVSRKLLSLMSRQSK